MIFVDATIAWLAVAVIIVLIVIIGSYRILYIAVELRIRKELSAREDELLLNERRLLADMRGREDEFAKRSALEKEKLDANRRAIEALRKQSTDDEVRKLLAMERQELQAEYEAERAELRAKAEKYLDGLRTERMKCSEQKQIAEEAEEQFRKEYEKWKGRNQGENGAPLDIELSPEQMAAFGFIEHTGRNFFIQGRAGTGKSTLVQYLKKYSRKGFLLASPTGAAAKIIGGMTIHSMFCLPKKDYLIAGGFNYKIRKGMKSVLENAALLIIDEVSMVRPDILDAIDVIAKNARENPASFGGLQMVLIGDLFQLPPVITDNAREAFKTAYGHENAYFFDAASYKSGGFAMLELACVHRQQDPELLDNLGNIIQQDNLEKTVAYFNSAKIHDPAVRKDSMTITPTNKSANQINLARLAKIETPPRMYPGMVSGEFDIANAPAPVRLILKEGAMVIFTNNNQKFINGTRGIVTKLDDDEILIRLFENGQERGVHRDEWFNYEYTVDALTGEIEEMEVGKYEQFPLRLGYAMTIHKAQGMTLDNVVVDKMHSRFFAHGQLYVALTRTRSKAGIHIERPIQKNDIIFDKRIIEALNHTSAQNMKIVNARTVADETNLLLAVNKE